MAKIEIMCPYCGNKMSVDYNPGDSLEIVCELCGSLLGENEIKSSLPSNFTAGSMDTFPSSSAGISSSPNYSGSESGLLKKKIGSPFKKPKFPKRKPSEVPFPTADVSHSPFDNHVQSAGGHFMSSSYADREMMSFPSSRMFPHPPQDDGTTTLKQALTRFGPVHKPKGSILLVMPQINQKILIPPQQNIFYFGRNTIIQLIGPSQMYDLEWLSSISRVRTDHHNHVVKEHFRIIHNKRGIFIEDRMSAWGTWLNGMQIKGLGPMRLNNGDLIELKLAKPGVKKIIPFFIHVEI